MLETFPEALEIQDNSERKPVEFKDHNGMLLLHHACSYGLTDKLLQKVINAITNGCTTKDNQGRQPWQLLKLNRVAEQSDNKGMSPLHHACDKEGTSLYFLKLLLDTYPELIEKIDKILNQTPTQYLSDRVQHQKTYLASLACSNDFWTDVSMNNLEKLIKLLVEDFSESVKEFFLFLHQLPPREKKKSILDIYIQKTLNEAV